jgi:hypothetical protein
VLTATVTACMSVSLFKYQSVRTFEHSIADGVQCRLDRQPTRLAPFRDTCDVSTEGCSCIHTKKTLGNSPTNRRPVKLHPQVIMQGFRSVVQTTLTEVACLLPDVAVYTKSSSSSALENVPDPRSQIPMDRYHLLLLGRRSLALVVSEGQYEYRQK